MNFNHFKRCPGCQGWISVDDVLSANGVTGKGLTVDSNDPDHCIYHFKHSIDGCNTTFVIHSSDFVEIMRLDISGVFGLGGPDCSGQCSSLEDLSSCQTSCRIKGLRELMLSISNTKELEAVV